MIILRQKAYAAGTGPAPLNLGDPSKLKVIGVAPATATQAPYRPMNDPEKMKMDSIMNKSYKAGQNSVGLKQGAMNTWNNMSKGQKIGAGVAAGAAAIGATAMIANSIKNKRKAKEAEERAKSAEARARY